MAEAVKERNRSLELLDAQYETLFNRVPGLYGVLFSTADGEPVSAHFQNSMDRDRLAAMSSSLVALGETMAREAQQQTCDYAIVQTGDGYIVSLRIGKHLLMSAFARNDTNLGMLLSSCQSTAHAVFTKLSGKQPA